MPAVENYNKVENVKENTPEWVKQKISAELTELKSKVQIENLQTDMFFHVVEENWEKKVQYQDEAVKSYLNTLNWLSIQEIRAKGAAWVMAVQIALESQWYNVWKIDWMLWIETKAAVRDFQTNQWIKVDWDPGPETISKLLEVLWVDPTKPIEKPDSKETPWTYGWDDKKDEEGTNPEVTDDWVDRTEKFKNDKFRFLKRKAENLLPDKVSMVWSESPNPENPEFTVKIYDKYNWSVVKYIKLNFHDYLTWDILEEDKLKSDIQKMKDERYDERDFQDRIVKNNKYSLEDLFPWQSNNVRLWQFFNKFRWDKLTIDNVNTHFDKYWDKLYLHFDKRWFNAAKWCDQQINKSDLKDADWKYNQEKFKDKLKDIVTKIVDENF